MNVRTTIILLGITFISCSTSRFNKEKERFFASPVQRSFKSVADMNDSYFEIRENRYFEFYRQLFDSVKNSSYPGKFTQAGDTMVLNFFNKKGYRLLGRKALVDEKAGKIIFFK